MKWLLLAVLALGASGCYVEEDVHPVQYGYYNYCDEDGNCTRVYERYYYDADGVIWYYHGGVWIRPGYPHYYHHPYYHPYYHHEWERRR
jgi:hypothetical protein